MVESIIHTFGLNTVVYVCIRVYDVLMVFCWFLAGPNKPIGLKSKSYTDTSVSLSWIAPPSDAGRPEHIFYIIRYKIVGCEFVNHTTSSKITNTSATISGLSPSTTYTFVVVAGNKVTEEFPKAFPLSNAASRTSDEATITTKPSCELHTSAIYRNSGNFCR